MVVIVLIGFLLLICVILIFAFLLSYLLFRIIFYVPARKKESTEVIQLPEGEIYEPFWEDMRSWVLEARNTPHRDVYICSFDGLTLHGKYYEYSPGAPIELMFHGYRGTAERDLSGGMQRCFQMGHSALIVDQRGAGSSEGNVISFGINEHRDCLDWVHFIIDAFGDHVKIILTGISMGASTVLIASGCDLPTNVVGVLADCGFTTAKEIIMVVADKLRLPSKLLYPFISFAAKVFGHFNLEESDALSSVVRTKVPVIFFHGLDDDYVPAEMSIRNYDACSSRKKLVLVPGAGHGLCYSVDKEKYLSELADFFSSL